MHTISPAVEFLPKSPTELRYELVYSQNLMNVNGIVIFDSKGVEFCNKLF